MGLNGLGSGSPRTTARGQLEWTKAQQVTRVATLRTAQSWVDRATGSSRRELEQKIKKTRAAAKVAAKETTAGQSVLELGGGAAAAAGGAGAAAPAGPARGAAVPGPAPIARVTIILSFDSLDAARLEAMIEAAKKSGTVAATATREEAILAGMAALLEGARKPAVESAHSPATQPGPQAQDTAPAEPGLRRRKSANPYKILLYRYEACEETEDVTSTGRHRIDPASVAAVLDNSVVHKNGKNRHAIALATREKVLARDEHSCQAPGSHRTRFLEIHHRIPREQGGSNRLKNLITLCSRCHGFVHAQPGVIER